MPVLQECLRLIKEDQTFEIHLIMTDSAITTINSELNSDIKAITELADVVYDNHDIGAGPASGSFKSEGMLVVPCSMKTLAGIHSGYSDNLLLRSADVMIKEQRPLILGVREAPFSPIHLRNMYELSVCQNVKVIPLMMGFYQKPETIDDMVKQIAYKMVEPLGVNCDQYKRWNGL